MLKFFFEDSNLSDDGKELTKDLVKGILKNEKFIDDEIKKIALNWRIERIANIDKNILRIAVYEILFRGDIPESVSINEAVELAKKYSGDESGKFVNGILGGLVRSKK
jgi:N utilization substance protein B